ncbi:hypothetical protein SOPP22_17965 [Shewanella sp. OPT22]|nr:hypothetical protein SOPP22_17965 [Shewanella sp. OPT22]
MKIKLFLAASLFAASYSSFAANTDYLEVGYSSLKFKDISATSPKGFHLAASKQISDSGFYLAADYHNTTDNFKDSDNYADDFIEVTSKTKADITFSQLTLGAGKIWEMSELSYIDLNLSYMNFKVDSDVSGYYRQHIIDSGEVYEDMDKYSEDSSADLINLGLAFGKSVNQFNFEIGAGAEQSTRGSSNTRFIFNAQVGYDFYQNWSANVAYRNVKDYSNLSANIQYAF